MTFRNHLPFYFCGVGAIRQYSGLPKLLVLGTALQRQKSTQVNWQCSSCLGILITLKGVWKELHLRHNNKISAFQKNPETVALSWNRSWRNLSGQPCPGVLLERSNGSEKREERNICTYSTYVYVKNERIMPFVTNQEQTLLIV